MYVEIREGQSGPRKKSKGKGWRWPHRLAFRLLLANTKASCHIVCAVPCTRLVATRVEQTLDVLVLPKLPPLVPLLLLLHDLPCQRCGRSVLDAAARHLLLLAVCFGFRLLVVVVGRRLGFCGCTVRLGGCRFAARFLVGVLLALLAAWRFLQRVCEALVS
mgnify:CR=1 FL=1